MSEWTQWGGGSCPLPLDRIVSATLRGGAVAKRVRAFMLRWEHRNARDDIVKYMVHGGTPVDPLSDDHEALTFGPLNKDAKDSNPKDAAASGRIPMHMVPDTLVLYAAMAFAEGDSKYVAYNFRVAGVRASVYISALRRHLMRYVNGEWADKKTKVPHLASVAACVAILIDGHVTKTIVYAMNKDKRPIGIEYTIATHPPREAA